MIDGSSDSMESPSGQDPEGAQATRLPIGPASEMLTPSELEQVRQISNDSDDYLQTSAAVEVAG